MVLDDTWSWLSLSLGLLVAGVRLRIASRAYLIGHVSQSRSHIVGRVMAISDGLLFEFLLELINRILCSLKIILRCIVTILHLSKSFLDVFQLLRALIVLLHWRLIALLILVADLFEGMNLSLQPLVGFLLLFQLLPQSHSILIAIIHFLLQRFELLTQSLLLFQDHLQLALKTSIISPQLLALQTCLLQLTLQVTIL